MVIISDSALQGEIIDKTPNGANTNHPLNNAIEYMNSKLEFKHIIITDQ